MKPLLAILIFEFDILDFAPQVKHRNVTQACTLGITHFNNDPFTIIKLTKINCNERNLQLLCCLTD